MLFVQNIYSYLGSKPDCILWEGTVLWCVFICLAVSLYEFKAVVWIILLWGVGLGNVCVLSFEAVSFSP